MVARRTTRKKKKNSMPCCNHMLDVHAVRLTTVEVLTLISAATHGFRCGYDDAVENLQDGINKLLQQCNIDCKWDEDGTMILTYCPKKVG